MFTFKTFKVGMGEDGQLRKSVCLLVCPERFTIVRLQNYLDDNDENIVQCDSGVDRVGPIFFNTTYCSACVSVTHESHDTLIK